MKIVGVRNSGMSRSVLPETSFTVMFVGASASTCHSSAGRTAPGLLPFTRCKYRVNGTTEGTMMNSKPPLSMPALKSARSASHRMSRSLLLPR